MRGKVAPSTPKRKTMRITPAYAGKSFSSVRSVSRSTDHPRLCGEKCYWKMDRYTKLGSPPPMRGKVSDGGTGVLAGGITPAYAGKSDLSAWHKPP